MKHARQPLRTLKLCISALLAIAGSVMIASPSNAVLIPGTGMHHLGLEADSYPAQWNEMSPGDSVDWQIWPVLSGQPDATLSLRIASSGDLTTTNDGLRLRLRSCPLPWSAAPMSATPVFCSAGAGSTVVDSPMASIPSAKVYPLGEIEEGSGPYFLATLSIPVAMTLTRQHAIQGWSGSFAFGFSAAGETATLASDGTLASTGTSPFGPLLGGAGMVLGGLALATLRRGPGARRSS